MKTEEIMGDASTQEKFELATPPWHPRKANVGALTNEAENKLHTHKKIKFLRHIHYFRAFAILNILIAHVWILPSSYEDLLSSGIISTAREIIFHDSTIYFLFISGFLFSYLSPNFKLDKYYKNKLQYIIFPFVFISAFTILAKMVIFTGTPEHPAGEYFKNLAISIYTGNAQSPYWYIPFIALIFLISPLLLKIPKDKFQTIIPVVFLLPLLGSRTGTDVTFLQYLYFFPSYLLGMYIAQNYDIAMKMIRENRNLLLSTSVISTIVLLFLYDKNYQFGFVKIIESVYYIQKLSLTLLFLLFFMKIEDKEYKILDNFATFSFSIFFLHTLVGNSIVNSAYYHFIYSISPSLIGPASILYLVLISFASLYLSMFLKKILGSWSRYIIGA